MRYTGTGLGIGENKGSHTFRKLSRMSAACIVTIMLFH